MTLGSMEDKSGSGPCHEGCWRDTQQGSSILAGCSSYEFISHPAWVHECCLWPHVWGCLCTACTHTHTIMH